MASPSARAYATKMQRSQIPAVLLVRDPISIIKGSCNCSIFHYYLQSREIIAKDPRAWHKAKIASIIKNGDNGSYNFTGIFNSLPFVDKDRTLCISTGKISPPKTRETLKSIIKFLGANSLFYKSKMEGIIAKIDVLSATPLHNCSIAQVAQTG